MNMKKKLFYVALAITALASCSSNDFVGDESPQGNGPNGEGAISFDLNTPPMTRGEVGGLAAATALNNEFIIWGEKKETNGDAAAAANQVFYNYKVNYTSNSAYTTTSNTKNWEYVGLTPYTSDKVYPALTVTQTIKYWDYDAASYTFTAVSAKPGDIADGKVKITKNTSGSTVYDKGYEIAVNTGASLDDIFVADRNNITKTTGTDRTATNAYGGNVTMTFRNFMSKIRFGIYETIPGYKVKITKIYYNSSNSTTNFGIDGAFLVAGDHTVYKVSYYDNNKVKTEVKSGTTPDNQVYFETVPGTSGEVEVSVPILTATEIGTTATTATFNKAETKSATTTNGIYTTILPYLSNSTNLKLKIDFQLISEDTGETINVTGKTAEVPAMYCRWQSNYAYSYIFKITDDGLYPITFDAVEVTDETGKAEYITTVSEPSITTFGVKSNVYSKEKAEYETGTDIYATFVKGTAVQTPSLTEGSKANYVQIYQVTTSDATNFPITEASVAERLAETPAGSAMITCTNVTTSSNGTYFTNEQSPSVVSSVPSEDGGTKTIAAVILPGAKTNTYAIEYITYDAGTALTTEQSKVGYYSKSGDVYTLQESGNGDNSTLYYKRVKTYKVIKVVATPAP